MNNEPCYYLGRPETGAPLDPRRFASEDEAYDYCVATHGEEAWNVTHVLMVDGQ